MENNIDNILDKFNDESNLYSNRFKGKKICIFGAGQWGWIALRGFRENGLEVSFFCDNNPEKNSGGFEMDGIPCISPLQLSEIKDEVVVFLALLYGAEDVHKQLKNYGIENIFRFLSFKFIFLDFWEKNSINDFEDDIKKAYGILDDEKSKQIFEFCLNSWVDNIIVYNEIRSANAYFEDGLIEIKSDEVFVDVGAYTGDTFEEFLEKAKNGFEKYIAFELNHNNAQMFNEKIKHLDEKNANKIELIEKGLSNVNNKINYMDMGMGSSITNQDNVNSLEGEIVRLDDELNERISFLKMDIESAELDALEGAKEHIKKYKPTLAICVYHTPTHLWEIPLYIKSLVPEYKIYLRHYSDRDTETVCYAIIED